MAAHPPDAAEPAGNHSAVVRCTKVHLKRHRALLVSLLAIGGLCLANAGAMAQVAGSSPGWTFDAAVYGWLTAMSGDLSVRGSETSFDESFADTVRNSDSLISFMGHAEAHYGELSALADLVYAKIGTEQTAVGPFSAKPRTELIVAELGGAYRLGRWWALDPTVLRSWSIEGLAGARYNSVSGKLDFQATDGFTPANIKQTKDWVDPFIGLRISAELANSFSASLRGDIGGFGAGSDFTWNAVALLGYHFDLFGQKADAGLGYRALDWNFSSGSGSDRFKWNMTLHGPVLGLLIRF